MPRLVASKPYPQGHIESVNNYVRTFLSQRPPQQFVGEFMDDEARRGSQFGLAGTALLIFLARRHNLDMPVVRYAEAILADGIPTIAISFG
jgi:hypothetical protein